MASTASRRVWTENDFQRVMGYEKDTWGTRTIEEGRGKRKSLRGRTSGRSAVPRPPDVISSAPVPKESASAHGSREKKNPDDHRPAGPPGRTDAARDHVVRRTPPERDPHLG